MKLSSIAAAIACCCLLAVPVSESLGRGFGGGGGRGGGGFGGGARGGFGGGGGNFGGGGGGYRGGGGNFGGGNFGVGNFNGGAGRANYGGGNFGGGAGRGNYGGGNLNGGAGRGNIGGAGGLGERTEPRAQGFNFNGANGAGRNGGYAGATSRGKLDSFLGLPSDEGFHGFNGGGSKFDFNHGSVEGPRGGEAAGATVTGPRGNTAGKGVAVGPNGGVAAGGGVKGADGGAAGRGVAVGPNGGVAAGRGVKGPNGGAAGQGIAAGPNGRVAGGSAVRGPNGYGAGRGFAAGPRGVAAGFARTTPVGRYACGAAVRSGFHDWGMYGHGWYGNHPGAWYAAGWAAGSAWNYSNWYGLSDWFGYGADYASVYYDYGNTVTYQDDSVYVNGESQGSASDYYDQAKAISDTGTQADVTTDGEWLPLGVFALSRVGHDHSKVAIQLAVDKQGVLRGNYTDTLTDNPMPVHGQVDKETQRVAFTVGDKDSTVFETGLDNLTKDEAPILIHFGKDRTEQWLLVRLKQPEDGAAAGDAPAETDDPEKPADGQTEQP